MELTPFTHQDLPELLDQILAVYRATFSAPPWNETEEIVMRFRERFVRDTQHHGFRGMYAGEPNHMPGFVYGYASTPEDAYHNVVARALGDALAAQWLSDCFEFSELAVLPSARGQGLGGKLHDECLANLPHRTSFLATLEEDTPALRLYQKRGWVVLKREFRFTPESPPYMLMGLALQKS